MIQILLSRWLAQRFGRSYVRQGDHPRQAALRAVDATMMASATGAIVILWLVLALPVWIIPILEYETMNPYRLLVWTMVIGTDLVIFGVPLVATLAAVRVVPNRRVGWARTITHPVVLLGSLLAILPAKLIAAVFFGMLV